MCTSLFFVSYLKKYCSSKHKKASLSESITRNDQQFINIIHNIQFFNIRSINTRSQSIYDDINNSNIIIII